MERLRKENHSEYETQHREVNLCVFVQGKYIHYDLISAKREAGYYGKSQSFKILPDTDSIQANIRLTQVPLPDFEGGDDYGDFGGGEFDETAPIASVNTATITTSGNAVV